MKIIDSLDADELSEIKPVKRTLSFVFGIVFSGIGLVIAYLVYQQIISDRPYLISMCMLTFVAIIFGGIGLMILYGACTYSKSVNQFDLLPSLESEWQSGAIRGSTKTTMLVYLILFLLTFFTLLPSYFVIYKQLEAGSEEQVLWLITAIVPLGFLVMTLKHLMQYSHYGESILKLPAGYGKIAADIRLVFTTTRPLKTSGDYKGTLSCVLVTAKQSKVDGALKDQEVFKKEIAIEHRSRDSRSGVEFKYEIPDDLPASDVAGEHAKVKWRFQIEVPTGRSNFKAKFLVPVKR